MELKAYGPEYYYLCRMALEDEGLTESNMSFERDHTLIVVKDNVMIGFFSFEMAENRVPMMNHFLLFRKFRGFRNMMTMLKAFAVVIGNLGYSHFIVHVPDNRKYFETIGKYWTKDFRFLTRNKDQDYYLVPVCGRGIR